jgi:SAM-dependent methyltransferase
MDKIKDFYAGLAPLYHLICADWDKSIMRQASMLDSIIRELCGSSASSILDVSCGIGTQSLGLASLGFEITASDLSPEAVERAGIEADKRNLTISLSVADMREAFSHHRRQFDVVISCDNSIPHLLTDNDIFRAFRQMHKCTLPGGCCIISVRDYEKEDRGGQKVKFYGIREENGIRFLLFKCGISRMRLSIYPYISWRIEANLSAGHVCFTRNTTPSVFPVWLN